MLFNIRGLVIWFLVFYFFIDGAIRDFVLYGSTDQFGITDSVFNISTIFSFMLYPLFVYWVLYKFYLSKEYLKMIIGIALAFLLPIFIRYFLEQVVTEYLIGISNYNRSMSFKNYFGDNYLFGTRFIPLGVVFFFVEYSIFKQNRAKDLQIANQKLELSVLKSQINPHFLLNSLNNIYSLVYHKSPKSLEALDKLNDLLKYNLYENKDKVSIREELKLVDDFIGLQSIRFDYPVNIDIRADDNVLEHKLPQFTLLPLIENIFKHGMLKDESNPAYIHIERDNQHLVIKSWNKVSNKEKDGQGGVGLNNLKKRLELIYSSNASVDTSDFNKEFMIMIKLPL